MAELCGLGRSAIFAEDRCGKPPAGILETACVHEHMFNAPVCAGCASGLQHLAGRIGCRRCSQSGVPPQKCGVYAVIWWRQDSGGLRPATVLQGVPRA